MRRRSIRNLQKVDPDSWSCVQFRNYPRSSSSSRSGGCRVEGSRGRVFTFPSTILLLVPQLFCSGGEHHRYPAWVGTVNKVSFACFLEHLHRAFDDKRGDLQLVHDKSCSWWVSKINHVTLHKSFRNLLPRPLSKSAQRWNVQSFFHGNVSGNICYFE